MSKFIIKGFDGKKKLKGVYNVSGSKNESLPAMAMAFLFDDEYILENVPNIEDMNRMLELLTKMGFKVKSNKNTFYINPTTKLSSIIDFKIGSKMRSSLMLTASVLARKKEVSFIFPGGCAIGQRPIDLTLKAYEKMGAKVSRKKDIFFIKAEKLTGTEIFFDKISVTGTESVIMAASLAHGQTTLKNAAMEPEVVGIGNYLKSLGVKIEGLGTPIIKIWGTGGKPLKTKGKKFKVISDRIEAGSVLIMSVLSGQDVLIKNFNIDHLYPLVHILRESGANLKLGKNEIKVLKSKPKLKAIKNFLKTHEFPGFPTDLQQQMGVYFTQCEGSSRIFETIYENRFGYVEDLKKMGAKIDVWNKYEILIHGKTKLKGKKGLYAPDLRGGFTLIIASILAKGDSEILNTYVIKRGYENIIEKLTNIGVIIEERK